MSFIDSLPTMTKRGNYSQCQIASTARRQALALDCEMFNLGVQNAQETPLPESNS